mmetsp:Transcript_19243/g.39228  ORF Transcript_19243/g.39228 Transcript_19243/m.39228 type:complete len:165 (-) Transcript_19243:130-624(-)
MSASEVRVNKEITEILKGDKTSNITATLAVDDKRVPSKPGWRHLTGTIDGPSGTPYEGGRYEVDVLIPRGYPFEPPKMKFNTKIWHPNVSSQTGAICLVSHWGFGRVLRWPWRCLDDDSCARFFHILTVFLFFTRMSNISFIILVFCFIRMFAFGIIFLPHLLT